MTAILCTANRTDLLARTLGGLAAALREGDELMVVETGGDGAGDVLAGLGPLAPAARHMRVEPPGKCRQLNAGLRVAQGEIILLTDDDVQVTPSWADEMSAPFDDPEVGLVCGPVRGLSRVPGIEEAAGPPPGEAPYETWRFAHGAAMAVRRRAAVDAGGWDERLGPGASAVGEDHDFVLRVRERGWKVMVAAAAPVTHLDWRSVEEDQANALAYERGGGAVVGAALRRSPSSGMVLLRRRLGYQRDVFSWNRGFGFPALGAFARGLAYGLRLAPRDWLLLSERRNASAAGWRRRRARSS